MFLPVTRQVSDKKQELLTSCRVTGKNIVSDRRKKMSGRTQVFAKVSSSCFLSDTCRVTGKNIVSDRRKKMSGRTQVFYQPGDKSCRRE
jgi:hypothetical protein